MFFFSTANLPASAPLPGASKPRKNRLQAWDLAHEQGVNIGAFLFAVLADAATWNAVVSEHPYVARAFSDLYDHLAKFDVVVMSNGVKDVDACLLHVARLAGVSIRVVNLGAVAGGYTPPLFSGATTIVAPSHYVAQNPMVSRNSRGLPVKVCHPVMDAARILKAARSCLPESRNNTGYGELRPTRFVMVGRVSTEKTPGLFVRALAVLQRRLEGAGTSERKLEGVMVGDGPLLEHMTALAQDLHAHIRFTGVLPVDEVPCEVGQATALVLPSTCREAFGMVGPEAMLLGVPMITFGFGGSGELVHHMENGLLVAEPTPRALADALEMLARSPLLRSRLGNQARLDALQALSLPEMVACHADEFVPATTR